MQIIVEYYLFVEYYLLMFCMRTISGCTCYFLLLLSSHFSLFFVISLFNVAAAKIGKQTLQGLIAQSGTLNPDPVVLKNMNRYFPQMVTNVLLQNDECMARECYNLAQQMPSTSTTAVMTKKEVTILDVCTESVNALILFGYERLQPVALKRLTQNEELYRLKHLHSLSLMHANVVPFEPFVEWKFIKMPRLMSHLAELKPLDDVRQQVLFDHMSSALLYLHSRGVAHMDVKPENIGLDSNTFILMGCTF